MTSTLLYILLTIAPVASPAGEVPSPTVAAGLTPASQAFKDPDTGRFTAPPVAPRVAARSQRVAEALSRSTRGLEQRPTETAAGGIRVAMAGRFRSAMVASKADDGTLVVECVSAVPGESATSVSASDEE